MNKIITSITSFFGFFILLFGLSMFISYFFVSDLNTANLQTVYDKNIDTYITNNLNTLKTELKVPEIKPSDLPAIRSNCDASKDSPFCNEDFLSGKITVDEVVKQMLKSQLSFENAGFDKAIAPIEQMKNSVSVGYGIGLFILGILLIFISKSFNVVLSLKAISFESAIGAIISAASFKAMPYLLQGLTSAKTSGLSGAQADLSNLLSSTMTEWMQVASDKAFFVCLIITGISAIFYIITSVIQKKQTTSLV